MNQFLVALIVMFSLMTLPVSAGADNYMDDMRVIPAPQGDGATELLESGETSADDQGLENGTPVVQSEEPVEQAFEKTDPAGVEAVARPVDDPGYELQDSGKTPPATRLAELSGKLQVVAMAPARPQRGRSLTD